MQMAILDLPAGRVEDAAAHLREGFQIALRAGARMYLVGVTVWVVVPPPASPAKKG